MTPLEFINNAPSPYRADLVTAFYRCVTSAEHSEDYFLGILEGLEEFTDPVSYVIPNLDPDVFLAASLVDGNDVTIWIVTIYAWNVTPPFPSAHPVCIELRPITIANGVEYEDFIIFNTRTKRWETSDGFEGKGKASLKSLLRQKDTENLIRAQLKQPPSKDN